MASSPLDPGSGPRTPDRDVLRGHGTRALGPSDSSDSGSDTAGPDVGDSNLDSDSDRNGTGERAAAARDPADESGSDIDADRIERIPEEGEDEQS